MTKFNLLSYLSNRERGRVKFKLQKSATLEYLEEKGSKPIINQVQRLIDVFICDILLFSLYCLSFLI